MVSYKTIIYSYLSVKFMQLVLKENAFMSELYALQHSTTHFEINFKTLKTVLNPTLLVHKM